VFTAYRINFLIRGHVFTEVSEAAAAVRASGHMPARALRGAKPLLCEILIKLLRIYVDAPILAINHHADIIRPGGGHVVARDLQRKDGTQKRGVLVRV